MWELYIQSKSSEKKVVDETERYYVKDFKTNCDLRKTEINEDQYNEILISNETKTLLNKWYR